MKVFGRKVAMSQIFDQDGAVKAVTLVELENCFISQIKTLEKDSYSAIQISFGSKKSKRMTKPILGHLKKANLENLAHAHEVRLESVASYELGQKINQLDLVKEGMKITVRGISKGKGFQGVVKRHHFKGGPRTHGQSDRLRAPGSLGQSSYPAHVFKNMRMAGRMGGDNITVKNLKIEKIIPARNLVLIGGAIPGANGALVEIHLPS